MEENWPNCSSSAITITTTTPQEPVSPGEPVHRETEERQGKESDEECNLELAAPMNGSNHQGRTTVGVAASATASSTARRMTPLLFALPVELRNQIFRYAFLQDAVEQYDVRFLERDYRRRNGVMPFRIQLPIKAALLVSKQFHAEAKDVFYRENVFQLSLRQAGRIRCEHSSSTSETNDDSSSSSLNSSSGGGHAVAGVTMRMRGDMHLIQHAEITFVLDMREDVLRDRLAWWMLEQREEDPPEGEPVQMASLKTLKVRALLHKDSEYHEILGKAAAAAAAATNDQEQQPLQNPLPPPPDPDPFTFDCTLGPMLRRQIGCLSRLGPHLRSFQAELWLGRGATCDEASGLFKAGSTTRCVWTQLARPVEASVRIRNVDDRDRNGLAFEFPAARLNPVSVKTLIRVVSQSLDPEYTYEGMCRKLVTEFEHWEANVDYQELRIPPGAGIAGPFRVHVRFVECWGTKVYPGLRLPDNFTRRLRKNGGSEASGIATVAVDELSLESMFQEHGI